MPLATFASLSGTKKKSGGKVMCALKVDVVPLMIIEVVLLKNFNFMLLVVEDWGVDE